MISITVDTKQVEAALKGLKQSVQDSVLRQALKKAADKGRTELTRQVAKEYAVTQADANAQM